MKIKTRSVRLPALRQSKPSRPAAKVKVAGGPKSIVVPVDFSETSLRALDYGLSLAGKFGSQIHLVHVLEFPWVFRRATTKSASDQGSDAAGKSAQDRLAGLIAEKVDEWITADAAVRSGRTYQAICETARERNADLIVIGTHGFTGLKHLLLGSTAERVLRHAPCSVLIVQRDMAADGDSRPLFQPKKILVPTDFSKPAEQALRSAVALARQYQAEIHLLYVVPVHYATGDYDMVDFAVLAAEQSETAQKKLAEINRKLVARGLASSWRIRHGRPAVEINRAAAELGCDLVMMATRGLTGWEHARLGSTTEEVVRHSLCPVLVVETDVTAASKKNAAGKADTRRELAGS